jgi:AhpD family alkylhydroperoxidase
MAQSALQENSAPIVLSGTTMNCKIAIFLGIVAGYIFTAIRPAARAATGKAVMEPRLNFYQAGPGAMKAMAGLQQQVARSSLEKPLLELIRLRASQINRCAYCVDLHTADALEGGESERRLALLSVWREAPLFSDRERAALEWTESLTRVEQSHVPDEVWQRVRPHFTPEELVDLTLAVATINSWNRFAVAFRKLPA